MVKNLTCPHCGESFSVYANPAPTADVVIYEPGKGIVLVERRNIPHGFALPGGFIDEGEWCEDAAIREMKEETHLDVVLDGIIGVYSKPDRDPRRHTMTTVFLGHAKDPEALKAGDDAGRAFWCDPEHCPDPMCFDHARIVSDFLEVRAGRRSLGALSTDWLLLNKQ